MNEELAEMALREADPENTSPAAVLAAGDLAIRLDQSAILQAETDLLGIDHASASALVAEAWHLPDWLSLALRSHHAPETGKRFTGTEALPALLAVGDRCSDEAGYGLWVPHSGIPDTAWIAGLGLHDETCREVAAELPDAVVRLTAV